MGIIFGNITKIKVDAIVNAAAPHLLGDDVDGAIHRVAGDGLRLECASLGGCKIGEAKCTGTYGFNARWVIRRCGEAAMTAKKSCCEIAIEVHFRSLLKLVPRVLLFH